MLYYVMKNKVFLNLIIGFIFIQFQSCIDDCGLGYFEGKFENKTNHIIKIVTIDKNVLKYFCTLDSFQSLGYFIDVCVRPIAFQFTDRQPQFSQELYYNADSVKVIFDDTYFYYLYKENDPTGIHSELGIENIYRNNFFYPRNYIRIFTELNYEYAKKQTLK